MNCKSLWIPIFPRNEIIKGHIEVIEMPYNFLQLLVICKMLRRD